MGRYNLAELVQRFLSSGEFPGMRIVKLASDGTLALAGAEDDNAIGVTLGSAGHPRVRLRGGGPVEVEVAAGETITRGDTAYQAADGKSPRREPSSPAKRSRAARRGSSSSC